MLFRKPPIWNLQPGLVARPWREHWRGVSKRPGNGAAGAG
jgi:hypothetical protein